MLWNIKILTLMVVFVYAFFKFIWSLRQFNVGLQIMGAAPEHSDLQAPDRTSFARITSRVISLGTDTFNAGVRAYYFGLAASGWLLSPLVLGTLALTVLIVLYRRDFRSPALELLRDKP